MRKNYDRDYEERESFSPWETYSDLYCGLLLVFVLLFFFAIYQYIDAREKNTADTAALQEAMREEQSSVLALYKADLEDRMEELDAQQILIDAQELQLNTQQTELAEQKELVNAQQLQLAEQKELVNAQQLQLAEQQALLESQQMQLKEQQALLDGQADQIEQIVGVRGQLIDALNREMTAHQIQVQADVNTGAIAVENTILFATDSNELREEGKAFFGRFMPVYLEVLLQPQFREYVAEIIIEGHTDSTGAYLHNLELSQKRALSVAQYVFGEECDFLDGDMITEVKSLITVNGCADKNPVYGEDGVMDGDKSRRVEIKFRLTDQEMIREMDELLNNQEEQGR